MLRAGSVQQTKDLTLPAWWHSSAVRQPTSPGTTVSTILESNWPDEARLAQTIGVSVDLGCRWAGRQALSALCSAPTGTGLQSCVWHQQWTWMKPYALRCIKAGQMWRVTSMIPARGRLRLENHKIETSWNHPQWVQSPERLPQSYPPKDNEPSLC